MNPGTHTITAAERARIEHIDRLFSLGPRGTGELVAALADPSWTVRRAAVAALATLGDDAVEPLCALLATRRDNENALAAAVDALASSRGAGVVPRVLALARHERAAVIADAAQILGRRRAAEAVPALVALLDHANDNVAIAAIEALGAIGGTTSVDALARVAAERRFFRTFPAMQVLARTGDPRAIAALAALLEDQTYRFEAVRALGRTGAVQAIAPITALLANPSDAVVRLVAVALAELIEHAEWAGAGPRVSRALREVLAPSLPRLLGALRHADREERVALATVLGRAGDGSVLRELTGLLDDEAVARAATSALEHLADASDDALVAALATSDAGRRAAILPLLRSRAAAPAIRQRLHDDDPEVRARACEALARVGDTACVPALFEALADRSARVAHAAVGAIQALGTAETEHLALAGARAANPSVRRHALRIIGAFGFRSGYEPVRASLEDPDSRIAEVAIVALGSIDDPRVDDMLAELASSRDDHVRSAVMRAVGQRGGTRSAALLSRGIADLSPWVRYYAAQGLGRLGAHDAPEAAARLIARLHDPAPQVRVAVIEALSQLGTPEAWDAVCRAAQSTDLDERRAGLVGVGMQGREGAAQLLVEAARASDAATRLVALAGLARLDDPAALGALAAAVEDPAPEVRDAALSLLSERTDSAAAQGLVDRALRVDEHHPAHRALSRPSAAHVVAILSRVITADDRGAQVLVAALARMRFEMANVALFEVLAMANPAARAAAASALVSIDAVGARAAVAALAATDPDPEVRRVCAAALAVG